MFCLFAIKVLLDKICLVYVKIFLFAYFFLHAAHADQVNPISTGGVYPQIGFAFNFFVPEQISPKFGNIS